MTQPDAESYFALMEIFEPPPLTYGVTELGEPLAGESGQPLNLPPEEIA